MGSILQMQHLHLQIYHVQASLAAVETALQQRSTGEEGVRRCRFDGVETAFPRRRAQGCPPVASSYRPAREEQP